MSRMGPEEFGPTSRAQEQLKADYAYSSVELDFYTLPKQTDLVHAAFNEEEEETLSVRQVNRLAYKESVPTAVQEVYEGTFARSSGLKGPFLWNPATDQRATSASEKKLLERAKNRANLVYKLRLRACSLSINRFSLIAETHLSLSGYQGVRLAKSPSSGANDLPEGCRLVDSADRPFVFSDCEGHRCIVLIPHEETRDGALQGLIQAAHRLRREMPSSHAKARGSYSNIYLQLHRDLGAKVPMHSSNYRKHREVADRFLKDSNALRYANHISAGVQTYLPHAFMRQTITNRKIKEKHDLSPLFGVYPSLALNFDRAVSGKHKDSNNTGDVPCAVMPLEHEDWMNSAFLVIEEAKLVFRLRPGDVLIFPSALFTHWNTSLADGLLRSSLATWASGNLESWADEDCQPRTSARPARMAKEVLITYK